jgi:hypothetical protein
MIILKILFLETAETFVAETCLSCNVVFLMGALGVNCKKLGDVGLQVVLLFLPR